MRTFEEIRSEIQVLSERRAGLWTRLSSGRDADVGAELKELDERLATLWDEQRALRARVRWGTRDKIVARARMEERLERAA